MTEQMPVAVPSSIEDAMFRRLTDTLRRQVSAIEPLAAAELPDPGGLGALIVCALMAVAADYLAEFADAHRPNAIEYAQDFLVRAVHAQVEKDAEE